MNQFSIKRIWRLRKCSKKKGILMSIQLLWEIQNIQHHLGSLISSPITIAKNILSTIHMIWTTANKPDIPYSIGALINFAVGDHIALAAQVVLVARKFLHIIDMKTTLEKSYKEVKISVSGEFPVPEESHWMITSKRATLVFCSTRTFFTNIVEYAWLFVDLAFSLAINSVSKEETKNSLIANIIESYNALKNDPSKISRELDEHQEFVDWLLTKLHSPIKATQISSLLLSMIETGMNAGEALSNTYQQADSGLQTGAFVLCAIVAPQSTVFIKTKQPTPLLYGNKTLSHTSCKSKVKPYSERFFSTY
jgi:hypothetical protein